MKKKDLKTGMLIEFKNGDTAIILLNTEHGDVFSGTTCGILSEFDDDLKYKNNSELLKGCNLENAEIVKIYQPNYTAYYYSGVKDKYKFGNYKLLWSKEKGDIN